MSKKITEENLLNDENVRESHLEKVEVLSKVKELITLPNTELMTTKMVAEWYEVKQDAIRQIITRHKGELEENGLTFKKYREIKDLVNRDNMSQLKVSRQGSNVFSKRALLNVGMLLRDSQIAKEVRSALLDQQEVMTDEQKTSGIDKKQLLLLNIIQATDESERAVALSEYNEYMQRHQKQLEEQIEKQKPMVEKYGVFMDSESTFTFTDVAKMVSTRAEKEDLDLKISNQKLTEKLRYEGVLSKNKSGGKWTNLPNKDYEQYFNVTNFHIANENADFHKTNTRVNPKGIDFIYSLLKRG